MKNKRTLIVTLIITLIASSYLSTIFAIPSIATGPTGVIRIEPPLPYMNDSPADFNISVQGQTTACSPIILLVMTNSSYYGLTAPVTVEWPSGGPVTLGPWTEMNNNGDKIPDFASSGAGYTVASLKDHLDTAESVWYAWAPILGENIEPGNIYEITVHLESDSPRMLVYVMGKSDCGSDTYDMRVPPTIPGFVVPEIPIGTVLSVLTMLGVAGLSKLRQK